MTNFPAPGPGSGPPMQGPPMGPGMMSGYPQQGGVQRTSTIEQVTAPPHFHPHGATLDPGIASIFEEIDGFMGIEYVSCNFSVTQNATSQIFTVTYTDTRGNQETFSSVQQGIRIILNPTAVSLAPGQSQQFTAAAYDTDLQLITNAVFVWNMNLGSIGSVDQNGLYTAPATVPQARTDLLTCGVQGTLFASTISIMLRIV